VQSKTLALAAAIALGTACAAKIDNFTVKRVVLDRGIKVDDLGKACALGESLSHPLASLTSENHPPRLAMLVAEATSALCYEQESWEAELQASRARRNFKALGQERAAEMRDAQILESRLHTLSAKRWVRSFEQAEAAYGAYGEGQCPRLRQHDELPYLLGMVAGIRALLHDKAGGAELGVPSDILAKVSRGASCLDAEEWWQVPTSLEAAAWAVIPGSEPEGVDPWQVLEDAGTKGSESGVRVALALYVLIAANADRTEDVERGVKAHAASIKAVPMDSNWGLLDEYARAVTRHESDLIWTEANGHRTETLGELPSDESNAAPDVFGGGDPFGSDPFAEPEPAKPDTPSEEPKE
jgi:hypothetical protein